MAENPTGHVGRKEWITLAVLTLSTFIILLDSTIVNIALAPIQEDLGGSLDQITWIVAGYTLSFAVLLITFGRLGDIYGRRLMFVLGIVVFCAASLGAAVSSTIEWLIAARAAQGLGAAMMQPATLSLIKATFPPQRLGVAFGMIGISAGLSTALGPSLGGIITTAFSWHYIFLINLPIGLATILVTLRVVPESRDPRVSARPDLAGILLSGVAVFFLSFALIEGQSYGWTSAAILGSFAAAVVGLVLFVFAERRVEEPLVDLSLFDNRLFAVGNVLRAIVQFSLLGTFFALPLFLQVQLGYSAIETGFLLTPLSITILFLSPIAGSLSDRLNIRWLTGFGMVVVAGGIFYLAHLSADTRWTFFLAPLVILGFGFGFLFSPTTTATLRDVPREQAGAASGISFTSALVGGLLGLAITGAVLQNRLVANVEKALASVPLPQQAKDRILSGISDGASEPPEGLGGPGAARVGALIQDSFAEAINTAFLCTVPVALIGALLAFVFFSTRERPSK